MPRSGNLNQQPATCHSSHQGRGFTCEQGQELPQVVGDQVWKQKNDQASQGSGEQRGETFDTFPGRDCQESLHRRVHCVKPLQSCWTLCDPMDCNRQVSLSMGFSRQEYWSGLPCPPPGDLPNPGIQPSSFLSPVLMGGFFTTCATWEDLTEERESLKEICRNFQVEGGALSRR